MEDIYIMAFVSASGGMAAERLARGRFHAMVIPTPGEISGECGFALRFTGAERMELLGFMKELSTPASLFALEAKGQDGIRRCSCLGSNFPWGGN